MQVIKCVTSVAAMAEVRIAMTSDGLVTCKLHSNHDLKGVWHGASIEQKGTYIYGSGSKHGGPWLTTENEQNRLPGGQLATVWSSSVHTVYSHCVHLVRLRVENESPTKSLGVNISPTFSLENVVPGSSK